MLGCILTIPVPPPGEQADGGAAIDAGLEDVALAPDARPSEPDASASHDATTTSPDASAPPDATTTSTGSSGGPIGQGRGLH